VYSETLATVRKVVAAAGLNVRFANYGLDSCNDQGDPPYMGTVVATFDRPEDRAQALAVTDSYRQRLIESGWSAEGAGLSHSTVSLTMAGGYLLQLTAVWLPTQGPVPLGEFDLYGPCSEIEGYPRWQRQTLPAKT